MEWFVLLTIAIMPFMKVAVIAIPLCAIGILVEYISGSKERKMIKDKIETMVAPAYDGKYGDSKLFEAEHEVYHELKNLGTNIYDSFYSDVGVKIAYMKLYGKLDNDLGIKNRFYNENDRKNIIGLFDKYTRQMTNNKWKVSLTKNNTYNIVYVDKERKALWKIKK